MLEYLGDETDVHPLHVPRDSYPPKHSDDGAAASPRGDDKVERVSKQTGDNR